jgi:tetratricopeptide (TPR) repeat protein
MIDDLIARMKLRPSDAATAETLAAKALELQREEDALPLIALAAERNATNARLWQWTSLLHRALDQHAEAMPAINAAAKLAPQDTRIAQARAQIALEAGLDALPLFETAIALEPNNGDLLLSRAAARMAQGDAATAIAELEALLAVHPGWYPGHDRVIKLRWMMGDGLRSTEAIERALTSNGGDLNLWRILIVSLVEAGRHEAALDAVMRGRAVLGPQLTFTANEAAARSELGERIEADALFEVMAKVDDLSVAIRHVRHLLRTGRVEPALPLIERWARPQGPNRAMWPYAAIAWRLAGDARADWLDDPAFIRVVDLADRIADLPALARRLRTLHRASAPHLDQSVRGGTQTDGPLFSRVDPEIRALRALVLEAVREQIASLPEPDPRHPLLAYGRPSRPRFAGSWSVRLTGEGGGHHANHVHPAGLISSAFYVTVPREAATGTQAGWLTLGSPQAELGLDLPPTRLVEPKPGRLVLFPSTMWHGTLPYSFGERMTVAFDIAPPLA